MYIVTVATTGFEHAARKENYSTIRAARRAASFWATAYRDLSIPNVHDYKVTGNQRVGYECIDRTGNCPVTHITITRQ